MSRPLSAFTGSALYLDTMVLYALVRNIEADAVKSLFHRIERGELDAFTSVLTFDELAYRLLLAVVRDHAVGGDQPGQRGMGLYRKAASPRCCGQRWQCAGSYRQMTSWE